VRNVNMAFPMMVTYALWSSEWVPVGAMRHAPKYFWAAVVLCGFTAASLAGIDDDSSSSGGSGSGSGSDGSLWWSLLMAAAWVGWLGLRAWLCTLVAYCALGNIMIGVAYMCSPKSNPPGLRWAEAAAKYKAH
jgi:hypothetical protein